MARNALATMRGGLRAFRGLAIAPEESSPSLVALVALLPPVIAGLILFGLPALWLLAVAVTVGLIGHLAARVFHLPVAGSLILPALVCVALVGPATPIAPAALLAVLAVAGELARARYVPGAQAQVGIIVGALAVLVLRATVATYASPMTPTAGLEPVHLWLRYPGAGQAPIDAVRLYVGNVPGPVFATSLLAVALGIAWMWYAGRLSLLVCIMFLAGALVPIEMRGWSITFQLLSGPLWFVAGLVLADRTTLPSSPVGRPLMGLAAGAVSLGVRARGVGIEGAVVAVAAAQLLAAGLSAARWLLANRQTLRARLRALPPAPSS